MKHRVITLLLAAFMLMSVLPCRASATEGSAPASVEVVMEPLLENGCAWINGNYLISYSRESGYSILSPDGKKVYLDGIEDLYTINTHLRLLRFPGSELCALYRDTTRLTEARYYGTSFEVGDCIVVSGPNGPSFFDAKGNARPVGKLPAGFTPVCVTSALTVIAREDNYANHFALFDSQGKKLVSSIGIGIVAQGTMLTVGGYQPDLYDLRGNVIFSQSYRGSAWIGPYVYLGRDLPKESNPKETEFLYEIYSANGLVGTFRGEVYAQLNSEYFIYKDNAGKLGLAAADGRIIVPAQYGPFSDQYAGTEYVENLYTLDNMIHAPNAQMVGFNDGKVWYVYNMKGEQLLRAADSTGISLWEDCISVNRKEGTTQVYDAYGNILYELPQGEYFESRSGVHAAYDWDTERYYLLNEKGEKISDGYLDLESARAYGLASVRDDAGIRAVNAAGEQVIPETPTMSMYLDFCESWPDMSQSEFYTVFHQDDKCGVCRYVPPIRECENSANGRHNWKQTGINIPATCMEEGLMGYRCAVCGAEKVEPVPIDPENHTWTITEVLEEGETIHDSIGLYTCSRCGETKEARLCAGEVFSDVPKESSWAHDPIDWAYFRGITGGTTANTFTPNGIVTRAEAMTFLWAALGHPDFTLEESPFRDVKPKHWFYDSVLWAVENQVTGGVEPGRFAPGLACSRAQIVTFLWAAAGKPEPETQESPFSDVKENDWFRSAVLWAAENNITGGVAPGRFGPDQTCTRAQAVTFLRSAFSILTAEESPELPEDPTDPTEPEDPTDPTEPENPTDPTEPEDPTEPIPEEPAPAPETP